MTTNPVRPGHAQGGLGPGAQPATAGPADPVPPPRASGSPDAFDITLRGYDRSQVDARIAELRRQLGAASEHAEATAARLAEQQRRAEAAEWKLREAESAAARPASAGEGNGQQGFGYRAERILRMAEAEAHETRSAAAKEASELLERARAEAEIHRHEIEQNLIMRATALDQKANDVVAALREREQAVAAELTSARSEAESVRAAARHEMEQARKNVEIVSRDVRAQAERWAEQHRAAASAEVAGLVELKETLHHDLAKLSENLLAGLRIEDDRAAEERAANERDAAADQEPAADPASGASPAKDERSAPTQGRR